MLIETTLRLAFVIVIHHILDGEHYVRTNDNMNFRYNYQNKYSQLRFIAGRLRSLKKLMESKYRSVAKLDLFHLNSCVKLQPCTLSRSGTDPPLVGKGSNRASMDNGHALIDYKSWGSSQLISCLNHCSKIRLNPE